jgi:flagellin
VQAANGTNSSADRAALQQEVRQLIAEVDRIGTQTQFNGAAVFHSSTNSVVGDLNELAVMDGLRGGWLENAERMVSDHYRLTADGAAMSIELTTFTDGATGVAARVVSSVPVGQPGKGTDLELQIDMANFTPTNPPNGGTGPAYKDRIIAHEMVHAVMARTMNYADLQNHVWFLEGTAEFIHGADERLKSDGGGGAAVMNALNDGFSDSKTTPAATQRSATCIQRSRRRVAAAYGTS